LAWVYLSATDTGWRTEGRDLKIVQLQKLRQKLEQQELEALLVSQSENRRYLSGFTGSAGWLLISNSNAYLAVDFRYVEQAKKEAQGFDILHTKGDMADWLSGLASDLSLKNMGFEAGEISVATYRQLCDKLVNSQHKIRLIQTNNLVESIRAVKETAELEFIAKASGLADFVLDYAKSIIRPGVREKDIAWELEKLLREKGSESIPFDIIVASGPNSALPHARPSERVINLDEPIIIDLGARVNGYCCDSSRTFCLGKGNGTFSKVYDIVLGAQLTALATIKARMSGEQADQLSRIIINQADYSAAFGHSLGHGVGLVPHELPRLGPNSSDLLVDGMVFTIEPGIYIFGWGGVRIEDTVTLKDGKIETLTKASKRANIELKIQSK
jgi:Xaa-Pro aminopeptidase